MNELSEHERVIIGKSPISVVEEHVARYKFAQIYAENKRVLDIACGSGYGTTMLYSGGAKYVIGGDISYQSVYYANKNLDTRAKEIFFFVTDVRKQSIETSSIDLIVSFETIEHVESAEEAFQEYKRVLAPDGLLIISTPNKLLSDFPYGWVKPFRKQPSNKFHKKEFTYNEFKRLLEKYFHIKEFLGQNQLLIFDLIPLAIASCCRMYHKIAMKRYYQLLKISSNAVAKIEQYRVPSFYIFVCSNQKEHGD